MVGYSHPPARLRSYGQKISQFRKERFEANGNEKKMLKSFQKTLTKFQIWIF